jgi:hypothetical protein
MLGALERFDRRWIFLLMGISMVLPLYFPIGLPITPSSMTRAAYASVEDLKAGDVVLVSLDLDPASTAELEPYYRSVILQLKRKNVKMAFVTLWYAAPPLIERWFRETVDVAMAPPGTAGYSGDPDRAYVKGVDYVYLGFREGKQSAMLSMAADMRKLFGGKTADGVKLDDIPFMKNINRLGDFKLMVLVSAGAPGAKEYVQFVQGPYNLRMVSATTAVSTTDLAPYYQSGQLLGLVAGLSGAAEYETLVGRAGTATQGADVLNIGHAVVILAIILGNTIFFLGRARRRRGESQRGAEPA